MYDVVALGELLIDFIQNSSSSNGNPVFEANPGGAPCNVLSMLAGLGYKTAFIGKVGDDYFGKMLGNTIKRIGISDEGLIYDNGANTTLAIVHTMADGDRDFSAFAAFLILDSSSFLLISSSTRMPIFQWIGGNPSSVGSIIGRVAR